MKGEGADEGKSRDCRPIVEMMDWIMEERKVRN